MSAVDDQPASPSTDDAQPSDAALAAELSAGLVPEPPVVVLLIAGAWLGVRTRRGRSRLA